MRSKWSVSKKRTWQRFFTEGMGRGSGHPPTRSRWVWFGAKQASHVQTMSGWLGFVQRRQWHPTPVLLPGNSHGWRSLVGCSPWGREESDTTERLHFHSSLSCIGGNGNPLQYSCLKNPRDGGPWWAAVYGVAQSRTRLKWLSSSRLAIAFLPRSKRLLISWL